MRRELVVLLVLKSLCSRVSAALCSGRAPGKRRLVARDEIKGVRGRGFDGTEPSKLGSILDARLRSALREGKVLLQPQPAELRTGLSVEQVEERLAVVERHCHDGFGPLTSGAQAALEHELARVGATAAQGAGLRNLVYRERQQAGRAALAELKLPPSVLAESDGIAKTAKACAAPPLDVLRRALSTRPAQLSPRLGATLTEAIVEASAAPGGATAKGVLRARRLKRLSRGGQHAIRAAVRKLDSEQFWRGVAWALANDLQGVRTKASAQRRSRAAERLLLRRLRAAGTVGRSEPELARRTSTPDFIVRRRRPLVTHNFGAMSSSCGALWLGYGAILLS